MQKLWIEDLREDRDHVLWIATHDSGLIRLHEGTAQQFGLAEGLPSLHVRCLLVDRNDDLWAGTSMGLARWAEGKFSVYRTQEGLASNDVSALCEAKDGSIWVGSEGDRLSVWNGSVLGTHSLAALAPPRGAVRAGVVGAADGSVWVGTTGGLLHVNLEHERRIGRADGLADDTIECLLHSRDGTLWVGTRDGISHVQGEEIETFRTRDGLSQSTAFTLCEDHEGSLWVGTKHGLNQFVDRRTIPLTVSEGLPSNDTGPLLQDRAGTIWVGTLGRGLARYDGRRCSLALSVGQGLPSDMVLALAEGGSDDLWIGTDHGLCHVHGGQIEATFTTDQGLLQNVVSCLCLDHHGASGREPRGLAELVEGRSVRPAGDATTSCLCRFWRWRNTAARASSFRRRGGSCLNVMTGN